MRDAGYAMRDDEVEVLGGREVAPIERLAVPGELPGGACTGLAM
jgi:hypothetical protein